VNTGPLARRGRVERWLRQRPGLALGMTITLFVGVFALRMAVRGTSEAVALLFVLPIALVAVAFGTRAGSLASVAGVLLISLWTVISDETLTPLGWVARATPMLLLGVLVGVTSDGLRSAEEAQRRLVLTQLRQREAAEIHDAIIQRLAAAKWSLEAHDRDRAAELLTESIATAQALVRDLLDGQADPTVARGDIARARPGQLPPGQS
jgi:signal transduction histidine kinase